MKLLPDSPIKLAIWLILGFALAGALDLPPEAVPVIAVTFSGVGGWLIVRKRRSEPASVSWVKSLFGTNTPLYTYGMLGFGLTSVLAILGLIKMGFGVVSRLLEWNWEGFALSSLEPLVPALVLGFASVLSVMLHEALHLNDEEEP